METRSADNRIWARVSDDGKHAAAGMSLGPVGTKRGGGGEDQPYDGHGRYLGTAGQGGISGGSEVRGKVSPPQKPKYPPPPAPREPHMVYSIEGHTLHNPDGGVVTDDAYSGKGQHRNKSASQDIEDFGPIPEGNWRVQEIMDPDYFEKHPKLQRPVFRLVPDEETAKRVGKDGMRRKPSTFLIHGNNKENDASQGCIILNKPARERLRNSEGGWIHVTR